MPLSFSLSSLINYDGVVAYRSFLEWLLDGSFAEKLRPYFILMMDLNVEEQQYLIRSMPRNEQELLLTRGMISLLPEVSRYM